MVDVMCDNNSNDIRFLKSGTNKEEIHSLCQNNYKKVDCRKRGPCCRFGVHTWYPSINSTSDL